MSAFKSYVLDGEREIPVVVEYRYHAGRRGARDTLCGVRGAGPPLEPDEPSEIELISVKEANGNELYPVDEANDERLSELAWEHWTDQQGPQE